jgi:hypothetical protein
MTTNYSFYVPRVHDSCSDEQVRLQFRLQGVGIVRRVDFNPILGTNFKKAFVHMESMLNTDYARAVIDTVFVKREFIQIHPDITNPSIYWILLKNTCPVPETTLNVHQLAENHRILEQLVFQQQQQIDQLQATLNRIILHGAPDREDVREMLSQIINNTPVEFEVIESVD